MSSDPREADPQQQEQMREYVEQLRSADPSEIVAQAFTMLGTGAEVKLGQPDARVLIDALAGMVGAIEERVPDELASGMRNGLTQLQQAQVQAESQASAQQPGAGEPQAAPSAGRGDSAEQAQPGGQARPGGQPQPEESSMTDRLWVPGRDAPPSGR